MTDQDQHDSNQDRPAGALAELTRDESSRRRFLGLAGAGGAAALSTFIAACGSDSKKQETTATAPAQRGGDIDIVNYALTLEYVEAAFYTKVVASGLFKGAQLDAIKRIGENEKEHVAALTATAKKLGGTPAPKPKTKFPLGSPSAVLKLAATVENLGAAAYLGQAAAIQSKEVLAAALSIHSVEGRHAAALNTLVGKSITPDGAFAKPASMKQVLAAVQPFIVNS